MSRDVVASEALDRYRCVDPARRSELCNRSRPGFPREAIVGLDQPQRAAGLVVRRAREPDLVRRERPCRDQARRLRVARQRVRQHWFGLRPAPAIGALGALEDGVARPRPSEHGAPPAPVPREAGAGEVTAGSFRKRRERGRGNTAAIAGIVRRRIRRRTGLGVARVGTLRGYGRRWSVPFRAVVAAPRARSRRRIGAERAATDEGAGPGVARRNRDRRAVIAEVIAQAQPRI